MFTASLFVHRPTLLRLAISFATLLALFVFLTLLPSSPRSPLLLPSAIAGVRCRSTPGVYQKLGLLAVCGHPRMCGSPLFGDAVERTIGLV